MDAKINICLNNNKKIRRFLIKENPNFTRLIEGRAEQRPFQNWLEERLFYMCLVVAKDSGLFAKEVRREKAFVKNTLYMGTYQLLSPEQIEQG